MILFALFVGFMFFSQGWRVNGYIQNQPVTISYFFQILTSMKSKCILQLI